MTALEDLQACPFFSPFLTRVRLGQGRVLSGPVFLVAKQKKTPENYFGKPENSEYEQTPIRGVYTLVLSRLCTVLQYKQSLKSRNSQLGVSSRVARLLIENIIVCKCSYLLSGFIEAAVL